MSIPDYIPTFSLEDAIQIAQKLYNLSTTAKLLPSYQDQNFMLNTENGERYVLKIANGAEICAHLEAQNQVMGHLAQRVAFCPQVVSAQNGEEILVVESASEVKHFVRLVTYLPGKPMGFIKRHSPELLDDIGFKLGQLTSALQGLDYSGLQQDLQWDFANGLEIVINYA
ncbi:MAG: phosphotransferase, partial [Anaerolineales bacterium]